MVYLFYSSKVGRQSLDVLIKKYKDQTSIYECFEEYFYGFFSTMFTLIYVSLGVNDTDTLENFNEGTLIQVRQTFLISQRAITIFLIFNF